MFDHKHAYVSLLKHKCLKVKRVSVSCFYSVRAESRKNTSKQHLYIENYNSGPNMLTLTSLTFFTAIFSVGWRARGGVNDSLPACKD